MNDRGIRRWALLGVWVLAALLAPACEKGERPWPEANTDNEGRPNEAQKIDSFVGQQDQPGTGGAGFQEEQQQGNAEPMQPEPERSQPKGDEQPERRQGQSE